MPLHRAAETLQDKVMNHLFSGMALRACMAAVVLTAGASPGLAQSSGDRVTGLKLSGDQPVQIESDKLEVRENERKAIFTGNVAVVQGPTLLKAGLLTVYYANDGGSATTGSSAIERLEASGKVYVKSENQIATGDAGTYDMKSETLVLTGQRVVLSEGENTAVGCKLTVLTKSGQAKLESCKNGGRVSIVVSPQSAKKN
jgi:lipopolysaccharide export system protein LptA